MRQAVDELIERVDRLGRSVHRHHRSQPDAVSLTRDWLAATDRQIAGWLKAAAGLTGGVTADDLRAYFNAFVADVRAGRAGDDAAAVASAASIAGDSRALQRQHRTGRLGRRLRGGCGRGQVGAGRDLRDLVAIAAAGLVGIADETMAAGEMLGDSVTDYRGTIDFLVNSGVHNAFLFGSAGLRNLFSAAHLGSRIDLLQFAGVLGQVLYSLHRPGNPNNLGEVGRTCSTAASRRSRSWVRWTQAWRSCCSIRGNR